MWRARQVLRVEARDPLGGLLRLLELLQREAHLAKAPHTALAVGVGEWVSSAVLLVLAWYLVPVYVQSQARPAEKHRRKTTGKNKNI